ncbi:nitroreductase family deazaflavin-dependent oxidoreductase [Streptomyces sp. KM273126]|uniref:nitroreductase/quinone reductase family protein n=1 Tax=Streptomyces sp. KM273126 TaxID=2545247 RepID=UPI00103DCB87|nr:nitroreductase/quinone reductase family protein [Streptomyces sp. KM273126]MBA2811181.1 nitroreductase family deazaflavin-dependent oxidoreductase [Streptomyces sp. KM273126]
MTFTSRPGTYGARQPGTAVRWLNKLTMRRILRKGGGKMLGGLDALVLTTLGKKSGEPRVSPVCWFPGDNGSWLIVASANGAPKNPAWYYNLAAHPDKAQITIDGQTVPVTAEQLHGEERARAWQKIADSSARFAAYQNKTDRELPVIRLTPRSA